MSYRGYFIRKVSAGYRVERGNDRCGTFPKIEEAKAEVDRRWEIRKLNAILYSDFG